MANRTFKSPGEMNKESVGNYATVNGLKMYYEVHGTAGAGGQPPLVLLHGALSATGTSFGQLLPLFAQHRQVISVEQQAHGRTEDIDRPLRVEYMAEDTVALLKQIGIQKVDLLGYSMGSGIALQIAIQHPELVRKLVTVSLAYNRAGYHPGSLDNIQTLTPEMMEGSPFHEEYMNIAPHPENFPVLLEKVKDMDASIPEWTPEAIHSIQAPTLLIIGNSDLVRPEQAVEMFRLLGGGVFGDLAGLPRSQLAVIPGSTHITVAYRGEWLAPMVESFLDGPKI